VTRSKQAGSQGGFLFAVGVCSACRSLEQKLSEVGMNHVTEELPRFMRRFALVLPEALLFQVQVNAMYH
jgi:hypothetical protein